MNTSRGAIVAVAIVAAIITSCDGNDQGQYWKVHLYDEKMESSLRHDIGPPTRERPVDISRKDESCSGTDAWRELDYDVPSRGIGKKVREIFGLNPDLTYVVCVNTAGQIVRVLAVEIH